MLRGDAPMGEAQIDYGYLGSWVDPVGGRVRRVQAFVVVLACSRHMFVRPVLGMDQASWTASHVAAWDYFAGVPVRLVSDNLKTGVVKADLMTRWSTAAMPRWPSTTAAWWTRRGP